MENKLQELTNKLYEEGLAKGRSDADRMVADAQAKAAAIVNEAEKKAGAIMDKARRDAEELSINTMNEVSLAGRQAVSALKENIAQMITAKAVSSPVYDAVIDPKFIKEMLLSVASGWKSDSVGKVSLSAMLPASMQTQFEKEFEAASKELLSKGVEVGYSDKVRTGFRIGEKNGGYYIGFSDSDLDALLSEFLKDKVAKILYNEK